MGHNHTLSQLAISKIVERFGRDDTHWEEVVWDQKKILSDTTYSDNCEERDEPGEYIDILEDGKRAFLRLDFESHERVDNIVDYERERLLRIRENKKQLLGLVWML